jgi:iron complex outermembrane receptor protein
MLKKTKITTACMLALGALIAPSAFAQQAASTDNQLVITGSRLKTAATEGASPVTIIDRTAIEASGQISVAELLRDSNFSSFGNTKPQSGNSAQALSDIDLRGLGSNRTLVLVDGRRISKAPFTGSVQDLNQIPLAAVERVEILSDGASAIYGTDAIGGVVNVITRKNFNGVQFNYGSGNPSIVGGDTKEMSLLMGTSGSMGRLFAGASLNKRGMIYTRDQAGGDVLGVSSFGNNYQKLNSSGSPTGTRLAVPLFACNQGDFYNTNPGKADNQCSFNFNASAANEAAIGNKSLFVNGEFNVNDDWTIYSSVTASNIDSFGRYASTPVSITLAPTSPAYLAITGATPGLAAASPLGLGVRHRMAAAGARDTSTDSLVSSFMGGTRGTIFGDVNLDAGVRFEKYKYTELGRGYIVRPLLEQSVNKVGGYNILDPFGNSADVLNSVKATLARESIWDSQETFATVSKPLAKIDGRNVMALLGFEARREKYSDQYDPQSEAGIIEGSAGNSSAGSRDVVSSFFEVSLPVLKNLEMNVAARKDTYKNGPGGNATADSPKISARWQPMSTLTVRGSLSEGFRVPTLDILTQKPSYSADSITDNATCQSYGYTLTQCTNWGGVAGAKPAIQIDGTVIANGLLQPETSKQKSLGVIFKPVEWVSLTADAYSIDISNRIASLSAQTVINRTLNPTLGPLPAAFKVTRDAATGAITSVVRGAVNEGTVSTNGYDLTARTDFKLGDMGKLQNLLQFSNINSYKINDGENLIGYQGNPGTRWSLSNMWTYQRVQTALTFNHIAGQNLGDASTVTKSYMTTNLSVTYRHPTKTTFSVGVRNLEGKLPELITYDGRPWNFSLYDGLGRQVYFRLTQAL